jgi:hypothetical protein
MRDDQDATVAACQALFGFSGSRQGYRAGSRQARNPAAATAIKLARNLSRNATELPHPAIS